ncbi:MAG: SPOR domain-containing protein [Bacteroidales bacterium]
MTISLFMTRQYIFLVTALLLVVTYNNSFAKEQGSIRIEQSVSIENLIKQHIATNAKSQTIAGYRIRIYRDNSINARQLSQDMEKKFEDRYPNVRVYRGYDNPYFKVSVGDFRTKDDALRFFYSIKRTYPKAYIVEENINFPSL